MGISLCTRVCDLRTYAFLSMLQEPLFASVQQGDLRVLMELLSRDASGINTCDEVRKSL